ncbi:MAG: hypothetical protein OMOMHJEC_00890 [Xanthomonadales bacterium]|nr:hypothetical protein [Xanthomonadales bacterium]
MSADAFDAWFAPELCVFAWRRCIAASEPAAADSICHRAGLEFELPAQAVFDYLRDLRRLREWWPDARAVLASPPGICGVGDVGCLRGRWQDLWFRVLSYRAGTRLVLAMHTRATVLLVDLWSESEDTWSESERAKARTPVDSIAAERRRTCRSLPNPSCFQRVGLTKANAPRRPRRREGRAVALSSRANATRPGRAASAGRSRRLCRGARSRCRSRDRTRDRA